MTLPSRLDPQLDPVDFTSTCLLSAPVKKKFWKTDNWH